MRIDCIKLDYMKLNYMKSDYIEPAVTVIIADYRKA